MSYVFDASAIFRAIKEETLESLLGNYTIELARYELGNTLWKERTLRKKLDNNELNRLIKLVKEVLGIMEVSGIAGREEDIMDTAERLKITFYDASYVSYAKEKNLPIITEDETLLEKTRTYIKSKRVADLKRR